MEQIEFNFSQENFSAINQRLDKIENEVAKYNDRLSNQNERIILLENNEIINIEKINNLSNDVAKSFENIKVLENAPIQKKARFIDNILDKIWKGIITIISAGLLIFFILFIQSVK
jgi:GTPase involved in cell partitioning and DNA repair